jgi:outer membrane protein TolC
MSLGGTLAERGEAAQIHHVVAWHRGKVGVELVVRVLTEKQALIDAQSETESNTVALRRILNIPVSQQVEFLDSDTFSETPLWDLPDPVSTALSQRPELLALS